MATADGSRRRRATAAWQQRAGGDYYLCVVGRRGSEEESYGCHIYEFLCNRGQVLLALCLLANFAERQNTDDQCNIQQLEGERDP